MRGEGFEIGEDLAGLVPHVFLIELDPVFFKEVRVFFPEGFLLMMFFLIADVVCYGG